MSKDEIIGLCLAFAFVGVYAGGFIAIGLTYMADRGKQ